MTTRVQLFNRNEQRVVVHQRRVTRRISASNNSKKIQSRDFFPTCEFSNKTHRRRRRRRERKRNQMHLGQHCDAWRFSSLMSTIRTTKRGGRWWRHDGVWRSLPNLFWIRVSNFFRIFQWKSIDNNDWWEKSQWKRTTKIYQKKKRITQMNYQNEIKEKDKKSKVRQCRWWKKRCLLNWFRKKTLSIAHKNEQFYLQAEKKRSFSIELNFCCWCR